MTQSVLITSIPQTTLCVNLMYQGMHNETVTIHSYNYILIYKPVLLSVKVGSGDEILVTVDREEEPLDTVSSGDVLNEVLDRVGCGLNTET